MDSTLDWLAARAVIGEASKRFATAVTEQVVLEGAHGRVLAQEVKADRDFPALRRSLRDGFAVRSADLPGMLRVRGERRAGDEASMAVGAGEAVEIMTGAPVPQGADAVLMVEHVTRDGEAIGFTKSVGLGQFVNQQGAEAKRGDTILRAGTRLDASHIAALASVGADLVSVCRRPSVAVLATGDELVSDGTAPLPHQIRNSNSHMLAALVRRCGAEVKILPVAPDDPAALTKLLADGLASEMLVVSGGVSAGKYDFVKPCLRELGVTFQFERVRIQPGQPTAFGLHGSKPVFGLPGNPGSTLVTFQLFAHLAIQYLSCEQNPQLVITYARLAKPFHHKPGLTRFLPAVLNESGLTHIPWQGSSDIPALANANVLLIADGDRESWNADDLIPVIPKL